MGGEDGVRESKKTRKTAQEGPKRLRKQPKRALKGVENGGRNGRGIRRGKKEHRQLVLGPQKGLQGPTGRAQNGPRERQKGGQAAQDGSERL